MTRRLPFMDGLRGVAASIVVFHHCFTHFPATFGHLAGPLYALSVGLSELNVEAVMIFFVVSGFSIRLSVEHLDLSQRAGVNEYFYRRLKRILPLYLFSLAFAAACVLASGASFEARALSLRTLLGNLLFLQTSASVPGCWFFPYAGNGPLWSLSFEMFYYVLFPIHHAVVSTPRARFLSAWMISIAGLALNVALPNPIAQFAASYAVWYCGVELAQAYLARGARLPVLVGLAWTALLIARLKHISATLSNLWLAVTLLVIGYAILRWATGRSAAPSRVSWLAPLARPFTWAGGFSYALYLLHFPIVNGVVHSEGDTPSALGLALVLSVAVAFVAERLAARPRYEFLKRLALP
jgi:peptidoglycan/LPS O-acetylase OafA/YrhL